MDVLPGFAAAAPLYGVDGRVAGVRVGDMGRTHDGNPGPDFTAGPEIRATTTVVAEGCRGSLAKLLIRQFALSQGKSPQTFALGFKELWQLPAGRADAAGWFEELIDGAIRACERG